MYFKGIICLFLQAQSLDFQAFCDSISKLNMFENGQVCASIRSVSSGQEIFNFNGSKSVNSASILKLATTATALKTLGPDFTFKTTVSYTGSITNQTLNGNLFILGQGDPTLGSYRFKNDFAQSLKDELKKSGINKINGSIIGDGSYFSYDLIADSWIWGDIGNYFGAPVSGLNWAENFYTAYFNGAENVYEPAFLIKTIPDMPYYKIFNEVLTGEKQSGDKSVFYASPQGSNINLRGTIPLNAKDFKVKGSIPDPEDYAAKMIGQMINHKGEAISKRAHDTKFGSDFREKRILYEWFSPKLTEIVKETNFESINLFADALLKASAKQSGFGSDFKNASIFLRDFWRTSPGFEPKDGSGLSMAGRVTASAMTDILVKASSTNLEETIPILGISGTVKNLGKNSKAQGNVHAKSGSIEGTRSYAGYYTAKDGKKMSFCFIISQFLPGSESEARKTIEQLMIKLVE